MAMARLCARRLASQPIGATRPQRARVFVIVPNNDELTWRLGLNLVARLARTAARNCMDVLASSIVGLVHRIEESNDFVVYVAGRRIGLDPSVLPAGGRDPPGRRALKGHAARAELHIGHRRASAAARIELALRMTAISRPAPPRAGSRPRRRHRPSSRGRLVGSRQNRPSLDTPRRGWCCRAAGARGFAHLGIIRALAARHASPSTRRRRRIGGNHRGRRGQWAGATMRCGKGTGEVSSIPPGERHHISAGRAPRGTQGHGGLLQQEYGDTLIEESRQPFFCISAEF